MLRIRKIGKGSRIWKKFVPDPDSDPTYTDPGKNDTGYGSGSRKKRFSTRKIFKIWFIKIHSFPMLYDKKSFCFSLYRKSKFFQTRRFRIQPYFWYGSGSREIIRNRWIWIRNTGQPFNFSSRLSLAGWTASCTRYSLRPGGQVVVELTLLPTHVSWPSAPQSGSCTSPVRGVGEWTLWSIPGSGF